MILPDFNRTVQGLCGPVAESPRGDANKEGVRRPSEQHQKHSQGQQARSAITHPCNGHRTMAWQSVPPGQVYSPGWIPTVYGSQGSVNRCEVSESALFIYISR